jgi:uncharacterized repeat protein (TIGR01451 family)
MRRLLFFSIMVLQGLLMNAQIYNPFVSLGDINPKPMLPAEFNGTGTISFYVGNRGTQALDLVADQEMTLVLTLARGVPNDVNPLDALSGPGLSYFNWSYDASINTFFAKQISSIPAQDSGQVFLAYRVTTNSPSGDAFNGFNLNLQPPPYSNGSGLNDTGDDATNGYTYVRARDYGDAPASYGSAVTEINLFRTGNNYANFAMLGDTIDHDNANQPSANADGDDANGINDEDGVTFPTLIAGTTVQIPVKTTVRGGNSHRLHAWIDWDQSGDFAQVTERVATNISRNTLGTTVANITVPIPVTAVVGNTYARFRYGPAFANPSPTDSMVYGEVEDYLITIIAAQPSIELVKTGTYQDLAPFGVFNAGDQITYTFKITNTGNVPLTNVIVNDPLITVNGSAIPLFNPGAIDSTTFTGTKILTQADINNGSFTNIATVTGIFNAQPITDTDDDIQNFIRNPSINLEKSALPQTYNSLGEQITYSFLVTNTGNVTLTNVSVSDTLTGLSSITPPPVILLPGASQLFTATYNITQGNLNAGRLINTATATGTPPGGGPNVTDMDNDTIDAIQTPSIEIEKTASPQTYSAVNDVITYNFLVTNTGNVTLTNVSVSDTLTGLSAITPSPFTMSPIILLPGASQLFTATYNITQTNLNAGRLINTATATGTPPGGGPDVTDMDNDTIDAIQTPSIEIEKTASPQTYSAVNDLITYNFLVTNTGNVTLTNVSVSDTLTGLSAITPPSVTLLPGASQLFTATYNITQTNLNAGRLINTATATGTPPGGGPDVTDMDNDTIDAIQTPSIEIEKTASPQTYSAVNDVITYNFLVTNTGNVTLTNVSVSDTLTGLSAITPSPFTMSPIILLPGASQLFTATYNITQTNLNAGRLINTATATGTPPGGGPDVTDMDNDTIDAIQTPSIEIEKTASPQTYSAVNDVITYNFLVTNTGNVTLTNVSVSDTLTGLSAITPPSVTLLPGASQLFTATYNITQTNLNAGRLINTATATGTPPGGGPDVTDMDNDTIDAIQTPSIEIEKTASPQTYSAVNDVITYNFLVTNTGNVTLTNVSVSDTLTGLSAITPSPFTMSPIILLPGASQLFTATYNITQTNLNAGRLINTATATGTPPGGGPDVTDMDNDTIDAIQTPSIEIEKTASPQTYSAVNDVITYNFLVTNTGNVTLTNVSVSDTLTGLSAITPPSVTLLPGASQLFTATYNITQTNLNAGRLINTATATGTPPGGGPDVTDMDNDTIDAIQTPSIEIEKTASPQTYSAVNDLITYNFLVTNTGNVTLTNVSVSDTLTGLSAITPSPFTMSPIILLPGASQLFTATYNITQTNLNAGRLINTATATGTPPGGGPDVTDMDNDTIDAIQTPSIEIEKTASPQTYSAVNDLITYNFLVTNTGNVTLTNVSVSDTLTGLSAITPPSVTLLPGASQLFTATYNITQTNLNAGRLINTATATGTPPGGGPDVTDMDNDTIDAIQTPSIEIEKTASPQTYSAVNDVITYNFLVTNTGNVTLTNVSVSDTLTGLSAITPSPFTMSPIILLPGASQLFTATYNITQTNLNAGRLINTATATGTPPGGGPDVTDMDNDTITANMMPEILLLKDGAWQDGIPADGFAQPGEIIKYTFTVTNIGNVTLTNLVINDSILGVSDLVVVPSTLAPDSIGIITYDYIVKQADIDSGGVYNIATATGLDPKGEEVEDDSDDPTPFGPPNPDCPDCTYTGLPQNPGIQIIKSSTTLPNRYSYVNDILTYNLSVTNTGNVTLTNVIVSDPVAIVAGSPIDTLKPGNTVVLTASYTVVQGDLIAGQFTNVATATGTYRDTIGVPKTVSDDDNEIIPAIIPDVTPVITAIPNVMSGKTEFNLTVRVTELNNIATKGNITVRISKDARLTVKGAYNSGLTMLGSVPLNNVNWVFSEDASNYIFSSTTVIPAGSFSTFGFIAEFDPGSTKGVYTITSQILEGSGGEIRINNNVDSEKIDYFIE